MAKILIVEDDESVVETILDGLHSSNHTTECILDGVEALDRLALYDYDMVILDWGLPRLSGIEVCKTYRSRGGKLPILMLTGRSKEQEKEAGLDSGADDYLTKPFSVIELRARVRALLRRLPLSGGDILEHTDLRVDTHSNRVTRSGQEIPLLPREYALLEFLLRHKNKSFNAKQLLQLVWSSESDSTEQAVRQCMMRLRKRLATESGVDVIENIAGYGYTIRDL